MTILVIDGQGGKIGRLVIERIKKGFPDYVVVAIGTNSIATAQMLKAGADHGATGENPVVVNSSRADVIIGPVGIISADSLLGEVTPAMAVAVGQSRARKILIPVDRCNIYIAGQKDTTLAGYIEDAVSELKGI